MKTRRARCDAIAQAERSHLPFTEQRDAVARNNAALANQINPEQSTGVFLDGLFGFTGGSAKKPATRSIINGVTLTGDAGTVVPAGTIARTA